MHTGNVSALRANLCHILAEIKRGKAVAVACVTATAMVAFAGGAGFAGELDMSLNNSVCDAANWKDEHRRHVQASTSTAHIHGEQDRGILLEFRRTTDIVGVDFERHRLDWTGYRPRASATLPHMDVSKYNRLSFWMWLDGHPENTFQIGFNEVKPFAFTVRGGQWTHVAWDYQLNSRIDFADITSFCISICNQGTSPGDAKAAKAYLSDFRVERVDYGHIEGWAPDPNEILLPYTAFYPDEPVRALVSARHAGKTFTVTGPAATASGTVSAVKTSERTRFAEINLPATRTAGQYRIRVDDGLSEAFEVSEHPYDVPVRHVLTAMHAMRCGAETELHAACHHRSSESSPRNALTCFLPRPRPSCTLAPRNFAPRTLREKPATTSQRRHPPACCRVGLNQTSRYRSS